MPSYDAYVRGKTAEEILAVSDAALDAPIGEYLRIAAQVRSEQELMRALTAAFDSNGRISRKVVWLTVALVAVGLAEAVATAWPYLSYWWKHFAL